MEKSSKRAAIRSAVPRAAALRAVADGIASEPITTRFMLGTYYAANLPLLSRDALILTGFDNYGVILCEKIIRGKPMTTPSAAKERIAEFADTCCPIYAAGRRADQTKDRQEASDECEAIFKVLYFNGSVLKEYVMVDGFNFTHMSGNSKNEFPLNDKKHDG